jgi:hypothetical protein|tara:strand:+ start:10218 stop:10772 length:555 start_codon:yes stop_codon:yes gene_type:complete
MINTKNLNNKTKMGLTPQERKQKVASLREEHEDYFQTEGIINALYIPKMAYRPSGKDELHVSFFPSEFEKGEDIYTEFVSIDYDTEDPKRTLYYHKHNPHWKEEYEMITSNSGFQRHIIPVSELKVVNDVTSRGKAIIDFANPDLPNPDETTQTAPSLTSADLIKALSEINATLNKLITVIQSK